MLEPVYLIPEGPALPTEYGKRWLDRVFSTLQRFNDVIRDVGWLAKIEAKEWDPRLDVLRGAGIPMAASGVSQFAMAKILDYCDGKTTTAFNPASVNGALMTGSPASTTTGVIGATETTNYTGYARLSITPSTAFNAATAATPSVVTNATALTWAACTASTATETGLVITDSNTINAGNAFFFALITGVVISATQTPPTIAIGALSISMNST